jgi:endonuclease YncB( thermonuclease family)
MEILAFILNALITFVVLGMFKSWLFKPKSVSVSQNARSIYVIDGDTLNIDGTRIRLFGMDAPEMGQSQGPLARQALVGFVRGHDLELIPIETDQYGRVVARVIRDDGKDLADLMVSGGFALASSKFTRAYTMSQMRAKRMREGFWKDGYVQNGRVYRRSN